MHFVGVQDDAVARQAVALLAAIAECLDAGERDPQRIGVVPVRCEGVAGKLRFHALKPRHARIVNDVLTPVALAQTFKTVAALVT